MPHVYKITHSSKLKYQLRPFFLHYWETRLHITYYIPYPHIPSIFSFLYTFLFPYLLSFDWTFQIHSRIFYQLQPSLHIWVTKDDILLSILFYVDTFFSSFFKKWRFPQRGFWKRSLACPSNLVKLSSAIHRYRLAFSTCPL
jgi:hypothetical protein